MSKLNKLIQILNLLYHRRTVTIEKIREFCRVSERTAYRYIRAISEANVPVYYDSDESGYRLNKSRVIDFGGWIPSEVALTIAALQYLANSLDDDYRKDIDLLLNRIVTQQSLPFERFWESWKESLSRSTDPKALQQLLTSTLINFAVNQNREVSLKMNGGESEEENLSIKEPVLQFKGNWVLSDAQHESEKPVPVAAVDSARVL
jgi:predicted DNA-binding transcriptional regulator YafY